MIGVARCMRDIATKLNWSEEKCEEMFVLGLLHDIGYEFENPKEHATIGGNILKNTGYKYWKEVLYHGNPNSEYKSIELKLLNSADMQISPCGDLITYSERLTDIKDRYGDVSVQYINAKKIVASLDGFFHF